MTQQLREDQSSLDQVEILNASCENRRESSLNILFKKVLVADIVTTVIGDKIDRVFRY